MKDTSPDYTQPVDHLLTLGKPEHLGAQDYVAMGLRVPDHVDALIRMACDDALHTAPHNTPLIWAPLHAWRALAQLGVEKAVQPLIDHLFWRIEGGDEWIMGDMPLIFPAFGVNAIPALMEYLNPENLSGIAPRLLAIDCMVSIGMNYKRADILVGELLYKQLERYQDHYPEVNAHLATTLMGIKPEAIDLIEKAAKEKKLDLNLLRREMLDIVTTAEKLMGDDFFSVDESDKHAQDIEFADDTFEQVKTLFPRFNRKKTDTNKHKGSRWRNRK